MTRGGLFVRLSCLIKAYQRAEALNRSFNIDFRDPAPDARTEYYNPDWGSDYGPWDMWFEPAGCGFEKTPSFAVPYSEEEDQEEIPHLWMSTEWACNPFDEENTRYAANLLYNLNSKTKDEIHEKYLYQFPNYTDHNFLAIHIRKGDKIAGDMSEAMKNHVAEYIVKLEGAYGREVDCPVFIASDSATALEEVRKWRPAWKLWHIEDAELKAAGGFSTAEFMRRPREFRVKWMRLLLSEFEMLRQAKFTAGSLVSHVYRFATWVRPAGFSYSVREIWLG